MSIENDSGRVGPSAAYVEAAAWSARLHSGNFGTSEQAELARWRASDPDNEKEFQAIERLGEMAAALPRNDVRALYGGDIPERPDRRRRRVLRAGLALAGIAGVAVGVGLTVRPLEPADYTAQLATRQGERRTVDLPDGSVLEMNTDTVAKVAFYARARRVELLRGEILFAVDVDVDADAYRPFVVDAGTGEVRVTGTRFNVRRDSARVSVMVESGSVEVSGGRWWRRDTRRLTARQATSFDENGLAAVADNVDVAAATAWRQGRLVFRDAPLSDVIQEMNRYLATPHSLGGYGHSAPARDGFLSAERAGRPRQLFAASGASGGTLPGRWRHGPGGAPGLATSRSMP